MLLYIKYNKKNTFNQIPNALNISKIKTKYFGVILQT